MGRRWSGCGAAARSWRSARAAGYAAGTPVSDPFRPIDVLRLRDGQRRQDRDHAAVEEPLEIRLHGQPLAVIMRTPGNDPELGAGFLLAEGVIRSADDLGTIHHCTDAGADHPENILTVTLAGRSAADIEPLLAQRRQVTTNSSCGLCGRRTIESLRTQAPPITATWTITSAVLAALPDALRAAQRVFQHTGGLHAAGLFTRQGQLQTVAEDVGRHNAVDKVIGRRLMREELPLSEHLLFVSGRTSFEIVQKAFFAGIPLVAAVSAPSTLAIEFAQEMGMTLCGFVRGSDCNVYAHGERVAP